MSVPTYRIREEFDRIALLSEGHGRMGDAYHGYLLTRLPPVCASALEVGCGAGAFTRLLAARSRGVVAIDLSTQMIRLARRQSAAHTNIEYVPGDITRMTLPAEGYDCVVSIATLHHLPLGPTLSKLKAALKPGGTLVIHDLVADEGLLDTVRSALAFPVSGARRLWRTGRLRAPRELREAWAEHGEGETYLTPGGVREMCRRHLPGAEARRHLLWRYTVVWRKRGE